MRVLSRDNAKLALQRAGLFPIARKVYRSLNLAVREQLNRETIFYGQFLSADSLCFDIGANLGQKSEVFLACGARVVIVEPNTLCQPTLRYLFGRNPKASIVECAIGSTRGSVDLHVHGTDATASVRAEWDKKVWGVTRPTTSFTVPVFTLDELIERFGIPEFIKIDVEGFELEVLKGLSNSVPLISFEYHASESQRLSECITMLAKLGSLSMRASNMDCDWLGPKTRDIGACLNSIELTKASGDLFVWIN